MQASTLEIIREELPIERFVGEGLSQAVVEGEVALPGGLREETAVLSSEAMAVLNRSTAENNRVTMDGHVTFHVLYTQGDPTRVHALEASADFTHAMDLPGAQAGMSAPVSLMVEHVEASAQGGRLKLMAILRASAQVFTDEPLSVVTGIRGAQGLMMQTAALSGVRTVASGAQDVLVRDECELGAALQITDTLYASAVAQVQDVMGGEERVTASGRIELEVTHLSQMPGRPVITTRHTIPFEETIPLSGETGDELICRAVVKDVAVLSQEVQEDGERTLRAEILLGISAHATRRREVCLLLDAYTTEGDELALDTQPVRRASMHRQIHTAESGKLTLLLDDQPPARTPLRAVLRPVVTDLTQTAGKLSVEGMMDITLLYMTDDDPAPCTFHTEEPFRMTFACDPSLPESLTLTPGNVEVSGVTSDRVEVKYILHLDVSDVQLEEQPLVTQVTAQSAQEQEKGILVCFTQPGETLWEIARRYRVSCDSLRRMNPELSDGPVPDGSRVILWRK